MMDAFNRNKADFTGVNGANDLFLTAFAQLNHVQITERSSRQVSQDQDHEHDHHSHSQDHHHGHHQVLKFERQFLYAVRHNPTGMITYLGRYYDPTQNKQS